MGIRVAMGVMAAAAVVMGFVPNLPAADAGTYETPVWRIAKLDKPPVIDGQIQKDEYARCPAIKGMITSGKTIVTKQQDVTWYLGYDDKNVYIAMRSPHPKGTWPIANTKENDGGNAILWDDHVEIQIATKGRGNACRQGMGFYKIMANSRGYYRDEWLYNGTAGSEILWSMGGEVKCTTTDEEWQMEIVAPIAAFGEKKLDGRDWVVQLVRADSCAGNYFAGWVGGNWLDWHLFGTLVFDPAAPVFRFLKTGEIRKGDMDLEFEAVGRGEDPQTITVQAVVTDPTGKEMRRDSKTVTLKKDETQGIAFKQALDLPEGTSSLHILATTVLADGTVEKFYEVKIPFTKLTEEVFKSQVQPWLDRRPKAGEFNWRYAYWASYGVAESSVDVDFFGMDEKVLNAKSFEVAVYPEKGGKAIATGRADLKDRKGSMILEQGILPEGTYVARMKLFGADGKSLVGERMETIKRHIYPWEGNTLGMQEMVFPPYTAIHVDPTNKVLKPCLREYTVGTDGLLSAVKAGGGDKIEDILTSSIHLEAEAGGKFLEAGEAQSRIVESTATRVRVEGSLKMGPATIAVSNTMDMTGWYDVTMTVRGTAGSKLDRLTLVIPLWKDADTLYVQRYEDGPANGKGVIPAGTGVVWNSGMLLKMGTLDEVWKSFVPIAYAGNGDKGVWWFGNENRDWVMSDTLPAVQYVRTEKGVELRVNLFAGPATLDRERTLRFALLVDPVKTAVHERKIGWAREGYDFGDYLIFGWRKWGRSSDGYWVEPEDLDALDKFLRGVDRRAERPRSGGFNDDYMANMFKHCREDYQKGRKLVLYGSHRNMMYDLPEWETFGGEWAGRTIVLANKVLPEKEQGFNVQGSYKNTLYRDMEEVSCNWTPSQVQCFMWYHKMLLEKTPTAGTWWDNGSTFVIKDYDPVRKEFYYRWNVFMRHELCKRLNTVGWQIGREPFWLNNMGADWAFNQVAWHVENGFDEHTPNVDTLDVLGLDEFRALFRTRRGIVHLFAGICYSEKESAAEDIRRRNRLKAGLCLLHDIGTTAGTYRRGLNEDNKVLSDLMDKYVGFFREEPACHFIGYWRTGGLVQIKTPGVRVSVYKGDNRAVLVVVNENREPTSVEFSMARELVGREPNRVFDAETGREFQNSYYYDKAQKVHRAWGQYKPGFFPIEGRGVRLIVVE